jgi:hypothetical protein
MGKNNRPDKIDPYPTVREEWIMDPNPWGVSDSAEDTKARDTHTWDRGTVAMIGGTQMLISRKTGGHTMGVAKHDSPVGKITRGLDIIDKLYNGYGNEIDNHKGPDQVALFKEGMLSRKNNHGHALRHISRYAHTYTYADIHTHTHAHSHRDSIH